MGSVIFKVLNYFYVTNQISTFVIDYGFDHQVSTVQLLKYAYVHLFMGDGAIMVRD